MKTHEAKNWGELAMILTARLRLQYICTGAAEGAPMIPFQRRGKARTPIDVFKTLSVPQMLTGNLARPELEACIVEVMNERYTHNLNRHMSRYVKGRVGL